MQAHNNDIDWCFVKKSFLGHAVTNQKVAVEVKGEQSFVKELHLTTLTCPPVLSVCAMQWGSLQIHCRTIGKRVYVYVLWWVWH